jgi:hypothetical protein
MGTLQGTPAEPFASRLSKPRGRTPSKARVRPPDTAADLALTRRQEQQRHAVERFNHKTFRNDWDSLLRDLFVRVVDGCPFAVGLFTRDLSYGFPRLKEMLNFSASKDAALTYVRRRFKLKHFEHIAGSLEGLAPHERYDLYKIISPGLGLPLNSLIYKIEHYSEPDLKAVIVFGGERLGGQMEVHLKLTTGLLEQPVATKLTQRTGGPEDSRYTQMIAALRAADPRKLRQSGLNEKRWHELREIVTELRDIQEQFPEVLRAKFTLLSKLVAEGPRLADAYATKPSS